MVDVNAVMKPWRCQSGGVIYDLCLCVHTPTHTQSVNMTGLGFAAEQSAPALSQVIKLMLQ